MFFFVPDFSTGNTNTVWLKTGTNYVAIISKNVKAGGVTNEVFTQKTLGLPLRIIANIYHQ